jgi:hypothetical protein
VSAATSVIISPQADIELTGRSLITIDEREYPPTGVGGNRRFLDRWHTQIER